MEAPSHVVEADEELSGDLRQRGAIILAIFGVIWAFAGASGLTSAGSVATVVRVVAVIATVLALLLAARSGSSPTQRTRRLPVQWRRTVGRVNLLQAGAIVLAVAILVGAGAPMAVPPTVCLIVGVHFFPLAGLFGQPQYRWTGASLSLVAATGLVALAVGDGREAALAVVGLGAAVSLLCTSAHIAVRG